MLIRLRRLSVWRLVAIALVLFAAWIALFMVGNLVPGVVHSGGCNYVPLVNGHPAYACPDQPH